MEKVEKFIQEHKRSGSNEIAHWDIGGENVKRIYSPWLTLDQARSVAEIVKEETIKEVCEWLDNHTMLSEKWYIEDLKKHLEDKA